MKIAVIGLGRVGMEVYRRLKRETGEWPVTCSEGYDPVLLQSCNAAVICTPFSAIVAEARKAVAHGIRAIFTCTEDWGIGAQLKRLPVHVEPHCGLAPGWVGDMARSGCGHFDRVDSVDLYAGALTEEVDNEYLYWPTWNVEGLIRELSEPCRVKIRGTIASVPAREGYRMVRFGDRWYEAFYTAGGAEGFLDEATTIPNIAYRSLRYPGHLDALEKNGLSGLCDLPVYHGTEKVLAAVTVKGLVDRELRAMTIVKNFTGVAEATAEHLVSRVMAWTKKEARLSTG